MNAREYANQLAKEAGLDETQSKALADVFANDKIANGFIPRPEFSRALDGKDAEVKKIRDDAAAYYAQETARAARNQEVVQRYIDTYGELPSEGAARAGVPGAQAALDASKYISRDDYQKEIQRVESQSLFVVKEGIKAASDYLHRFGKPLDIDALEQFAVEKKLPINLAYQEMIKPEVEARQTSSFEERLKAAREEGARDALSRVKIPVDTASKEPSVFASALAARQSGDGSTAAPSLQDRLADFSDAYNGTNAASGK